MKITVISGSHRSDGQSLKVANVIVNMLEENKISDKSWLYSLSDNPLPLWDSGVWEGEEKWNVLLQPLREQLKSSDAFVIVTPEWHGQVPAGLKNFFLLCSQKELGHKPALIVSVSSGDGGAYPVAELRMSSYKNNRLCYIPEQVIIRKVESVLNSAAGSNENTNKKSDEFYRDRLMWSLKILREYGGALQKVRESGVTHTDKFKNGM